MLRHIYDKYVVLPESDDAYKQKVIGFIENYEFPCTAVCDGFYKYFDTKLKKYYSFKKGYLISNRRLVTYNKRLCLWRIKQLI